MRARGWYRDPYGARRPWRWWTVWPPALLTLVPWGVIWLLPASLVIPLLVTGLVKPELRRTIVVILWATVPLSWFVVWEFVQGLASVANSG